MGSSQENIDPASIRSGRFDRIIKFELPNLNERSEILKIHSRNKPIDGDVDFNKLAQKTIGMTGSDLANVMNESAILTARANKDIISTVEIEEAVEKVSLGLAKNRKITESELLLCAVHEAHHAVATHLLDTDEKVYSVTVKPRANALGYVRHFDENNKNYRTKNDYINSIKISLAGVVGEEYMIGEVTSGCSSDLKNANRIIEIMLLKFGMSAKVDYTTYDVHTKETRKEAQKVMQKCRKELLELFKYNEKKIVKLIKLLLEKETIYYEDMVSIFGENNKSTYNNNIENFKSKYLI